MGLSGGLDGLSRDLGEVAAGPQRVDQRLHGAFLQQQAAVLGVVPRDRTATASGNAS
ncbi:hypothetical protein AB0K40_36950 [Nonomuraea bangladeshensis]|uniref:Uncharacterized protein n=1 Tax=Nonomuraea bangladeshensis TaxID=404385 RepID=A0ABV3HF13_9ACTN